MIKLIFAGWNRIIMIRRELPQTSDASPARPVANVRRGFSFVLAPAAADLVLELDCFVQGFCFSLVGRVFVFVFSCSNGLLTSLLCLNSYGPDKAQQFTGYCRHDLPVILAGHGQFPVTLVQAILCLPCDFGNLCRNPLLSFTQLGSDTGGLCR